MKKSELYALAMEVVADSLWVDTKDRLEVLEQLFEDRKLAKFREEQEEKKQEEKA